MGWGGGGGGAPYNGLYGKASPERSTFFEKEVYKRVGISRYLKRSFKTSQTNSTKKDTGSVSAVGM